MAISPAWITAFIAGGLYFFTSAGTITWIHESQDSGELAACAAVPGVPHPTGYPLYILAGWLMTFIFGGADPARVMVIFSVICAAFSAGIIARTCALAIQMVFRKDSIKSWIAGLWGAVAAMFAVISPVVWSQAIVCEVYSLAFLLQSIAWFLLVKYLDYCERDDNKRKRGTLILIGLMLGLIAAHHIAGAMILIPVLIIVLFCPPGNPRSDLVKAMAALLPGLALYLLLPIRSLMNPVLDWGNPENFHNFMRHVTGEQYQSNVFGTSWAEFIQRVGAFPWEEYWGITGVLLILAGAILFLTRPVRSAGFRIAVAMSAYIAWTFAFATAYNVTDFQIFYYPLMVPASIFIASGLVMIASRLGRVSKILIWILVIFVAVTLFMAARDRFIDMDASDPERNSAAIFAQRQLSGLPENSIVIVSTDGYLSSLTYGKICGITNSISGERVGPRDDIDILASYWIVSEWYHQNVHDRYGDDGRIKISDGGEGDFEGQLQEFIDLNQPWRPIFIDGNLRGFIEGERWECEETSAGVLFRIVPSE